MLTTELLVTHDTAQEDMNLQEDGNQHSDEGTQSEGISLATSSAYSLIETSHPLFGKIRRLWNSADESHREVCLSAHCMNIDRLSYLCVSDFNT